MSFSNRFSGKRCAVVDFFHAHDHLMPSIIEYLNILGFEVEVLTTSPNFEELMNLVSGVEARVSILPKNKFRKRTLSKFIEERFGGYRLLDQLKDFDLVFLNTFRADLRATYKAIDAAQNIVGVMHTPILIDSQNVGHMRDTIDAFLGEGGKFFVLGENVADKYGLPYIDPLTYVSPDRRSENGNRKCQDEPMVFCVPGTVKFRGRNYMALADAVSKLSRNGIKGKLLIKILGRQSRRDGMKLRSAIRSLDLEEYFSFVQNSSHAAFYAHVTTSDYILPLLDRGEEDVSAIHYSDMATSSIYLAMGLGVPMVAERDLSRLYRIEDFCIAHESKQLEAGLRRALEVGPEGRHDLVRRQETAVQRRKNVSIQNLESEISQILGE